MTARPVHDDCRSETGSTESVFWRKSRHSAAGARAACIEAVLAVRLPDGSLAVEIPDGEPVVIMAAPAVEHIETPLGEHLAEPPTEIAAPWTRGSLDEQSANPVDVVTRPPNPIEAEAAPQLDNAHGLPGFDAQTRVPDVLADDIGRALRGGDPNFIGRAFVPDRDEQAALAGHFTQNASGLREQRILHVEQDPNTLRVVGSSKSPWSDEPGAVYVAQVHQDQGVFTVPMEPRTSGEDVQASTDSNATGFGHRLTRRPSLAGLGDQAPVVLVSCKAAVGARGSAAPAQSVANETGRVVYAPNTDIYVSDAGFALGADASGRPGQWVKFYPGGQRAPEIVTSDLVPVHGESDPDAHDQSQDPHASELAGIGADHGPIRMMRNQSSSPARQGATSRTSRSASPGHDTVQRAGGLVLQHDTNVTEQAFYQAIRALPRGDALRLAVPHSYEPNEVLRMENKPLSTAAPVGTRVYTDNIMHGMVEPHVLDIRVGARTASRHELQRYLSDWSARLQKAKIKFSDKTTGTSARGYQVTGGTGVQGGRGHVARNSVSLVRRYVEEGSIRGLAALLRDRVKEIGAAAENSGYAFIASTVQMAVDHRPNDVNRAIDVRLTDFAHAFKVGEGGLDADQHAKYVANFRDGIRSLADDLDAIAHGQQAPLARTPMTLETVLPRAQWWRLSLDPIHHAEAQEKFPDNPGELYDHDESPGFQRSMEEEAFAKFLNDPVRMRQRLTWSEYEAMHDAVNKYLVRKEKVERSGTDGATTFFPLRASSPTESVLNDWVGDKPLLVLGNEAMIKYNIPPYSLSQTDPFTHPGTTLIRTNYKPHEVEEIFNGVTERYYAEVDRARNDFEVARVTAWAVRTLQIVHLYDDTNRRLNVHVVLPRLLLSAGLRPVLYRDMEELFQGGRSLDDVAGALLQGQRQDLTSGQIAATEARYDTRWYERQPAAAAAPRSEGHETQITIPDLGDEGLAPAGPFYGGRPFGGFHEPFGGLDDDESRPTSLRSFGEPGPTIEEFRFPAAPPRAPHVLSDGPQLDEPQDHAGGGKLALIGDDPAFAQARKDAVWEPREATWVDPISYVTDPTKPAEIERDDDNNPVLDNFGRPKPAHILYERRPNGDLKLRDGKPVPQRFAVRSSFDARRFTANGVKYTDLTVKIRADGKSMTHEALAGMWDAAQQGVEEFYNQGEHLPSTGDRLHVTIELVRPDQPAHLTVTRAKSLTEMNQHAWFPGAKPVVIAHELSHQVAMARDEYQGPEGSGIEHRPDIPGSLVGDYRRPIDPDLPRLETDGELRFQGLRDRHLQLIDRVVGSEELIGPRPAYRRPEPASVLGASPRPPRTVSGVRQGHAAPTTAQALGRHVPSRDTAPALYHTDDYELRAPYSVADLHGQSERVKLARAAFAYRSSPRVLMDEHESGFAAWTPTREVFVLDHPTLQVSGDGSIAMAAESPGSHREFYALPEVFDEAQARLEVIEGNVSLEMNREYSVTLTHNGEQRVLYRVTPKFENSPTDVCRDFSEQVLGGPHTHVVLSDTTPDGDGRTTLGRVRAIDQYEISGVSDLIDAMTKAADSGRVIDVEEAAGVVRQGRLIGAPTPGEAYGKAVASWGFDGPLAMLNLGGHAYGQVGESYVVMSVPDREEGLTRTLDRDYSVPQVDAEYVEKNGSFGYHFGPVLSEAADGNGQVVIQNLNSRGSTRYNLDTAIDRSIAYHGDRLPRAVAALERKAPADDPWVGFARSLREVQRLNGELAAARQDPANAGRVQSLGNELRNARSTAQKALSSLVKDSFGFGGDQWFLSLHGRAPGDSFFDFWTGAGENSQYANPTSFVMVGGHGETRTELHVPDGPGGLSELAERRLEQLGRRVAKVAMWSARNGMPLPQLRTVLRAAEHENPRTVSQRDAAVREELEDSLNRALDTAQETEPLPGGLRLTADDIVVSRDIQIVDPDTETGVSGSSVLIESAMHGTFDDSLPSLRDLNQLADDIKLVSGRSGPTAADVARTAELVKIGRQVFGRGAENDTDRIADLRRLNDVVERELNTPGPLSVERLDAVVRRVFRKNPTQPVDDLDRRNLLDAVGRAKRPGSRLTGAAIDRAAAALGTPRQPGAVYRDVRVKLHEEMSPVEVNALFRRADEINQRWNRYRPLSALTDAERALEAERQDAVAQVADELQHHGEDSAVALAQQLNARRVAGGATAGASARSPHSLGTEDLGTVGASARSPHSLETEDPTTSSDESDIEHTDEPVIGLESRDPLPSAPIGAHAVTTSVHDPGTTQDHEQQPIEQHPIEQQLIVAPVGSGPVRELSSPRSGRALTDLGWAHARLVRSWDLQFDPRRVGSAYDALLAAGGGSISVGGRVIGDAGALRQEFGDQVGAAEPGQDAWSAAAAHLGASVLILHGDRTMSAHGSGPVLVVAESRSGDANGARRWVGLPPSTEDPALSGLSAAQVHWAAVGNRRFTGPSDDFFDVVSSAGRGAGVRELDYAPQVLRDRLVHWLDTGLTDENWRDVLGPAGLATPHEAITRPQVIENIRRGSEDGPTRQLLPLLTGLHYGVGIEVVHPDGDVRTHGAPGAQASFTVVPAASHGHGWFSVGDVRPPRTAGAGTRPADVAGGLGWADPHVPVTGAEDHVGPEPSDAQLGWAYDHGRHLLEIPAHPDAVFDAILRSAGGGFTVRGEYVGDPARLRELIADEVNPALAQDLGLALVVHTIYAAHTPSGEVRIDSGAAQDDIVEAIRNPGSRPDLADELVPYFANRLGLGVRTVDPSGVVGRYGSGRPVYLTWTADQEGTRHWAAAPSDASRYSLGSALRAPNLSDPALFLLNHAIDVRKNALRAVGTNDFGSDPVISLLQGAQTHWLAHGPEPRSTAGEPLPGSWHPDNLRATVDHLVQTAHASIGGTGEVTDTALGAGLHAGLATELFDGLFPQGIGHQPDEAGQYRAGVAGLPADQWILASPAEVNSLIPRGGAALLLGGDRAMVLADTPHGRRLVEFGADRVGGPTTGRVTVPTPELAGGEGLALIVDAQGHPLSADHLSDVHEYEFDSAAGWSFGPGFTHADPETGAPVGVSAHQAEWARQHGTGFLRAESGPNGVFDAVIKAAGGVLSAHGVDVTDATRLRQVLSEHLRDRTAAPNTLRDFPSVHAAFIFEGVDRVIEEFFDQDPRGASPEAVHLQLDEHISSGKASAYVVEAMAEPGRWEHVAQSIALDVIADWAGRGVLSVDPRGQVRLHGDQDAPRLAVGRLGTEDSGLPGWVALTPEHLGAGSFEDAAVHTATSLTPPIPHTENGEDSFYHAVLDASGGAIQIDRDTLVSTPAELKNQLTTFLLDRPDVLDAQTRESIERSTGIPADAGVAELIDALADPDSRAGEVVARHLIGGYLGRELSIVEPDGTEHSYGSGRPIKINSVEDEHGGSRWAALPLESRDLDLGQSHDLEHEQDHGASSTVEAERVEHTQWAPSTHTPVESGKVPEDPWRSATFCVTIKVNGVDQKACVSVAVLTLDAALAAELGVAMH